MSRKSSIMLMLRMAQLCQKDDVPARRAWLI